MFQGDTAAQFGHRSKKGWMKTLKRIEENSYEGRSYVNSPEGIPNKVATLKIYRNRQINMNTLLTSMGI